MSALNRVDGSSEYTCMEAAFENADDSPEVAQWSQLLAVLPIPAALITKAGTVLTANRWIDEPPGTPLVSLEDELDTRGLLPGANNASRWLVRPISSTSNVMLATSERDDVGDHLLRRFFSAGDWLYVVYDQWGRIIEANAAWERLLGYSFDEVYGIDSWSLLPRSDTQTRAAVERSLRTSGQAQPVFKLRTANGGYRTIQWALHFDPSVGRCFGLGRDITDEQDLYAELERRALTDELTGLANRFAMLDCLESVLTSGDRPAILFCDLNRFKIVNDSLGHLSGDALLTQLGERLEHAALDEDALVARIGGDEFVILLGNGSYERAIATANDVLSSLRKPFVLDGRPVHVSMGIGIAVAEPGRDGTAGALLAQADTAAYEAKKKGGNDWVVFDSLMQARVDRRFNVESEIRDALENERFEVLVQPFVEVQTGAIIGGECLVRMRQRDGSLASPGHFLDVAEDAGLLPAIGSLVLTDALGYAAKLNQIDPTVIVSINVSGVELNSPNFTEHILALARESGVYPETLLIEITEQAIVHLDYAVPTLDALRATGMRVALDDFGTGFSSLAHLRELPIDVVKVDRSFVQSLDEDRVTREVTASLLSLAKALGLGVVLEGVETRGQLDAVAAIGGTLAQGYLMYRPMPFPDFVALVSGRSGRTEAA